MCGSAVKKITKPFEKVAKGVAKGVSKTFKVVGRAAEKTLKETRRGITKAGQAIGVVPEMPDAKQQATAPDAPSAEQYAEDMSTPENIGRRKRNRRTGLRIDLNTGGNSSGNGVNIPVG